MWDMGQKNNSYEPMHSTAYTALYKRLATVHVQKMWTQIDTHTVRTVFAHK